MRRLSVPILVAFLAMPVAAQEPQLDRVIDHQFQVFLPIHACSVPGSVTGLAKVYQLIAGVEFLPGDCSPLWAQGHKESVDLNGMTITEALDKLIALDPRYRWVESDGVILVRPVIAWADPTNALNQVSERFDFDDKSLNGALISIVHREGAVQTQRTEQGLRTFSVHTKAASVVGVLNATVRQHGAMWWEVRDFKGDTKTGRFVWLFSHDGAGLGTWLLGSPH